MPMRIRQHKWDPRKSLTHVKIKDFEIENNSRYKIRSLSAVSRSLGFCTLNIVYKARVWISEYNRRNTLLHDFHDIRCTGLSTLSPLGATLITC